MFFCIAAAQGIADIFFFCCNACLSQGIFKALYPVLRYGEPAVAKNTTYPVFCFAQQQ
jgi:hypothetical protein